MRWTCFTLKINPESSFMASADGGDAEDSGGPEGGHRDAGEGQGGRSGRNAGHRHPCAAALRAASACYLPQRVRLLFHGLSYSLGGLAMFQSLVMYCGHLSSAEVLTGQWLRGAASLL